jgi:Ni/Co efflux regulator RcnB
MRKFLMIALAATAAIPATAAIATTEASAQSRAEIQHDRRVVREERRELREARRFGTRQDVRAERRDLARARQELREDRADRRYSRNYVRYVAPYSGWSYRPVTIGFQLSPVFYSSRYHIANPYHYGLRPVGRFQRWVRYGDDLLLVNVRTGRVIRVVHNYYW